ncbi:DUF1415 domain-containing protein [Methylicorpusculum sp.]|uniref:DUF1415 domain-containing protein n=1 Tax=Methylicorpusculum sp. TaxID=2713644 RepID=UPI00272816A5|nr:DUF1415 domain-containing protein [Methylicorpusculum sp.]MDO8842766.1 DUF1415 domain-containing protein [Methylicorpusculum sp.]
MSPEEITEQTRYWLETVVIDLNLCPFARKVHEQKRIRYSICFELNTAYCLDLLLDEFKRLDKNPDIATTLLIYAEAFSEFDDYLELLGLAEDLLLDNGYEGIYQLASFHPDYRFDSCDDSDPANFTNRSPYPMLHLLRESDLEMAIAQHPDASLIPENNIALTRKLGLEQMQKRLAACYTKNNNA